MSRTLPPALLRHKEPARRIQSPLLGTLCLLLAVSLWHKNAYNMTFPCMEANYPYAIKNQRGASKKPLVGGFLRGAGLVTYYSCYPVSVRRGKRAREFSIQSMTGHLIILDTWATLSTCLSIFYFSTATTSWGELGRRYLIQSNQVK